jgi:hypothetical protein
MLGKSMYWSKLDFKNRSKIKVFKINENWQISVLKTFTYIGQWQWKKKKQWNDWDVWVVRKNDE